MAIILVLLLSYISGFATQVEGQPSIVEPYPDNVHAIENSTAQVSCTVIDRNGAKPDRIIFFRKNKYGETKIINDEGPNGRIYYEKKIEDGGKRLQVILHINRVLLSDDSWASGYECRGIVGAQWSAYGFTMNVIRLAELPRMNASGNKTVEFGENVKLSYSYTNKNRGFSRLVQIAWLKDGDLIDAFPACNMNLKLTRVITITSPHQGGLYSCRLTFKLRGVKVYNIARDIAVTVKPRFFANDLQKIVKVAKGKSAKMVCSAKGNPLTTVWSTKNVGLDKVKPIKSANPTKYMFSNLAKLENHTLTITKTALSDAGRYYCCIGNDSRPEDSIVGCQSFVLIVKDLPDNWLSDKFENLLHQAKALLSVDYIPPSNASGLLHALENATKKQRLNGGDLDVSVKLLSLLTNRNISITSCSDRQNFLGICSNILEPINMNSWIQFEDQKEMGDKALWDRLMVTLDKYGLQLAKEISDDSSVLIETANIVMKLDRIAQQNKAKKTGLTFEYAKFQSSLYLPSALFCGDVDYHVVNILYKTLHNVMRLQGVNKCPHLANQVREDDYLASNATIFSSLVDPPSFRRLDQKVKITMKNNKVIEPALQQTCVFWKEGLPSTWFTDGCSLVPCESNKHVTTCECDHLAVFASLMDPYGH